MKKILVVDDEEKIRTMICDYLQAVGFETVTASDGIEAITQTVLENPDFISRVVLEKGLDAFQKVGNKLGVIT